MSIYYCLHLCYIAAERKYTLVDAAIIGSKDKPIETIIAEWKPIHAPVEGCSYCAMTDCYVSSLNHLFRVFTGKTAEERFNQILKANQ